jgi:hypothetical protein
LYKKEDSTHEEGEGNIETPTKGGTNMNEEKENNSDIYHQIIEALPRRGVQSE